MSGRFIIDEDPPVTRLDSRFVRLIRFAVEHAGLIVLAVLLCGGIYLGFPEWNWPELYYPLFLGLVGIRVFAERAAGPERNWVPRGWSLVAGIAILFAYLSRHEWPILFDSPNEMSLSFWIFSARVLLLGLGVPLFAYFHLRAVERRSGSLLLGWLTTFLFVAYLPLNIGFDLNLPHLSLSRFPGEKKLVLGASYMYCFGDYIIEGWGIVTLFEFFVVMKIWRRRPFPGLRLREWESSLPFAIALLGAPFGGMRYASRLFFRFFGNNANLEQLLPWFLVPAVATSTALGIWLALMVLPEGESGKSSGRDRAIVLIAAIVFLVPFYGIFDAIQTATLAVSKLIIIWAFCSMAFVVDVKTARRRSLDDEAIALERQERAGLRELVHSFRSPSHVAPSRLRRFPSWSFPTLVWGALLALSFLVFPLLLRSDWFAYRLDPVLIDPLLIVEDAFPSPIVITTLQLYFMLLFAVCVAFPVLFLIPWRIASRFPRWWNTARVRDAWLTNLPSWRIFWGPVIHPVRTHILLVSTSAAIMAVCIVLLFISFVIGPGYIEDWHDTPIPVHLFIAVLLFAVMVITSIGLILLVIGFSRRRALRGPVAYGLALICQIVFWIGVVALLGYTFMDDLSLTPILAAFALWYLALGRWAFAGVPEAVQRMAGE